MAGLAVSTRRWTTPVYRSTALRHPKKPLLLLPQRLTEMTGPLFGDELLHARPTTT